jgi:hypothetical protein
MLASHFPERAEITAATALLQIVWMNFRDLIAGSLFPQGFAKFPVPET